MSVVYDSFSVHLIAAARQRDPQRLVNLNQVRVRNIVDLHNMLGLNQTAENVGGDMKEAVVFLDFVDRDSVGDAGAV